MVNINQAVANAKRIKSEIQRAKSYLDRHEMNKGVDTLVSILIEKLEMPVIGADKFDIDMFLADYCTAFNKNPLTREFLNQVGYPSKPYLSFKPGQEKTLLNKLAMYQLATRQREASDQAGHKRELRARRDALIRQGRELLEARELPKARICLKKAAEQFGGEPGVLAQVGTLLLDAGAPADGADILRRAIDAFPDDRAPYKPLLRAYLDLGRSAEAEALYLETLKTFGPHPQTYLNLAKFYLNQRRVNDAADAAARALDLDPSLEEAKAIVRRHG